MRVLILGLMIIVAPVVAAAPHAHRSEMIAARDYLRPAPKALLDNSRPPKVGSSQAVEQVKRAYSDSKILSMQLMESGKGPPVYRVKTLTSEGVVKYIYVDAMSGDVFE